MHIHFSDLPNGQEDDKWHQLLQIGGGAKAAPKGSLRLVANFKDHMILPLEEYDKLKQVSHGLHPCSQKFGSLAGRVRERKREREGEGREGRYTLWECTLNFSHYCISNMVKVVKL